VGANGLLFGNAKLLLVQALASVVAIAVAIVGTWGLLRIIRSFLDLRVAPADEREGLDVSQHGEQGYAG
jgi:Amt family ammonium transporter